MDWETIGEAPGWGLVMLGMVAVERPLVGWAIVAAVVAPVVGWLL